MDKIKKFMQLSSGLIGIAMLVGSNSADLRSYAALTQYSGRLNSMQIIKVTITASGSGRVELVTLRGNQKSVTVSHRCIHDPYVSNGILWIGSEFCIDLASGNAKRY